MSDQKVYMPLMIGDWLKGTRGMKAEIRGVYLNLLLYQWDNGFVPSDIEELCLIDPELPKVWDKLKAKFIEVEPGKLQNKKNEEVRAFWRKQRQNGQKGGRPKNLKPNSNLKTNPKNNPNKNPKHNHHNDIDLDNDINKTIEIPFKSAEFQTVWADWHKHRREIRKKLTPSTEARQLRKLATFPEARAIYLVTHAIERGWQGLVYDVQESKGTGPFHAPNQPMLVPRKEGTNNQHILDELEQRKKHNETPRT